MARLHLLGICGTFMGSLALLARELGHRVTGSDENVYPPMSTLLADHGVDIMPGYDPAHLQPAPDLVIVGNALSRGNPAVEAMLNRQLRYTSGPAWLRDHVLSERFVVAVAGTHGKTTTASALAWVLEQAGLNPGFLIGGVPGNFGMSARTGDRFFVVEADEYDTAFFDKRSKFVHYRPRIAVLNNLEFDHADIFDNVEDIRRQFHHLVRTVPGEGALVVNGEDRELDAVLELGSWTPVERFHCSPPSTHERHDWEAGAVGPDCSRFAVRHRGHQVGEVRWSLIGRHNMANALACIAAAHGCGVPPAQACAALQSYIPVKRRLEIMGEAAAVQVLHDFAHHPTAIRATLEALRAGHAERRLLAVLDPRSNTMKMGVHRLRLKEAFAPADQVYFYRHPDLQWAPDELRSATLHVHSTVESLIDNLARDARPGDCIVVMSNGHFDNLPARLLSRLRERQPPEDNPG